MATKLENRKRKIFIVDDHPLVREWLGALINRQPDLGVCGEASDKAGALQLIGSSGADLAVIDISLEGGSGIDLMHQIKSSHPSVAMVVLSMHDESAYAERAIRAGARGYVAKRQVTGGILDAIRAVLAGKLYLSEKAALLLAAKQSGKDADASPIDRLSDRELEVFQCLGRGHSTRQVAEELRISQGTVHAFCARIKEKLSLNNASELLREAVLWNSRQDSV
jgi:DNA-binding NarL/FixJ family response regulator